MTLELVLSIAVIAYVMIGLACALWSIKLDSCWDWLHFLTIWFLWPIAFAQVLFWANSSAIKMYFGISKSHEHEEKEGES